VFRDFDVFGIAVPPCEADAILIVDPDAVLPLSVAAQRLQPIARRNQKIREGRGAIESDEAPKGHSSDAGEFLDSLTPKEPFRLFTPEAPDHESILTAFT
jgi:hypothetical protein